MAVTAPSLPASGSPPRAPRWRSGRDGAIGRRGRRDAILRRVVGVSVSDEQRESYDRNGFFRIEGFADRATGDRMLERVIELARRAHAGEDIAPAFVLGEQQPDLP